MALSAQAMSSLTEWKERQQQSADQVDLHALLSHVRTSLRAQGLGSWVNVSLALEKAQNESGGLTNGTLKRLLNDCRVSISDVDARALVQRCTQVAEEDGKVSADTIKNLIFGPLSGRKLELVQSAFDALDRKGVGYLALPDVLAAHDAARHPAVMFGEQTTDQVSREFQTTFMIAARRTGTAFVSWAQWLSYFQCVAAQAPSEEYFELLMKRVWRAASPCSLQEAAGAVNAESPLGSSVPSGSASVAPISLLQALQHNQPTGTKTKMALTVSTALPPAPSRVQHRSSSLTSLSSVDPDASPRGAAVQSTNDFLRGSQFAACLTDVTSPTSPVSNNRSGVTCRPASESLDAGVASVLRKLQAGLRGRGLQALVQLGRSLRLSDQNGDAMLTLAEFRRALQTSHETSNTGNQNFAPLSDADLRGLFRHLDCDRSGYVPIDAALDLVRDVMSSRRLRLVQTAYQALARETGVALLDACDVVQRYDASRHPDVIAKRKSEEQCFREFVENFDMEENNDGMPHGDSGGRGKISLRQWESYYHNVSFFVQDDDLFELIVRNTWHLPPTSSSNEVVNKTFTSTPATDSPRESGGTIRQGTPVNNDVSWHGKRTPGTGMASQQAFAILQPDLTDRVPSTTSAGGGSNAMSLGMPLSPGANNKQSKELRRTIHFLRCELKERGLGGFIMLQQQLQRAAGVPEEEFDNRLADVGINFHDFVRALKSSGVRITGRDAQNLFHHFDSNHDGTMSISEFLSGVREPMNDCRQLVVRMAFDALDRSGSGELDAAAVAATFDARRLPEVLTGRKTDCEAHAEFLDTFGLVNESQRQRRVNFDIWERYYANVSATIDEDEQFEQMVRNAWHVGPSYGARGSSGGGAQGSDIGIRLNQRSEPGRSGLYEVLDHSPRVATADPSDSSPRMTLRRSRNNVSDSLAACLGKSSIPQQPSASAEPSLGLTSPGRREYHLHPAGVQAILSRLKQVLQAQGTPGFCTLSRRLRATRGNAMNLQDLRKAALDSNLTLPGGLTDADLRLLFQYLDSDNDGRVAPDELIAIVRPPLAGRRLEYVREAFAKLAKATGSHDLEKALLEPSDVVEEFDASAHPDVVAGRRGADHVCREFLETFDIDGGAQGGKVTWEQWRSYYHNVSASIASDKAFEDMVCSVWHLNLSNNRNSHTEDLERQPQQQPQQTHQRVRGKTMMSNVDIAHQASTTPSATEAPVSFIKERKILSLKDIASGTGIAEASRAVSSRNQFLGTDAGTTYAGDMILHAIKHRIRQSSSLADVVQLRLQLSQASDARTGSITASRCCESLNAALGLALSEAHGRALFEHLSQANADASSGSSGARFLQDQQRANGHDSGSSRLLLRLVLGCFLDRLSPACLASATHVFSALQSAGNGRVFPAALASSFQASRHPAVVLGRMTTAEAFQDFARNFEVASGGSTDGSVAFQHFEAFCVNLRATLGTDELLQMVLRDCFRVARYVERHSSVSFQREHSGIPKPVPVPINEALRRRLVCSTPLFDANRVSISISALTVSSLNPRGCRSGHPMVGKKRQRSPTAADCPLTPPQVGNSSPPSSQQENDTCKPNQERRSSTSNASTADSTESPPAADSQAELQQPKRRALVWFRRDLRVHDNLALDAALQAQEQLQREEKQQMALLPVYILHRPTHVRCGPIRFQFLLESIEDLAETIADLKGRLRVLRGDAEQVLELVIAAWGVTDLFFEEAVMPYGVARDDRVRGIATSLGVQVTSLRGVTLYDPHEIIRRNDGHAPTDYERLLEITDNMPMPAHPLQTPAKLSHADRFDDDELLELMKDFCRDSDKVQLAETIAGIDTGLFAVPPLSVFGLTPQDPHTFIYGGETKALRALDAFFEESQRVGLFQKPRTSPVSVDAPSTTSLSPYLTFGCLSAREFFNRIMFIQLQFQNRPGPTQVTLEGQLMWREFFYCYAAGVPHFDSQERNPLCKQIDWKLRDEEHVLKPESDHEEIVAKDADEKIALEHFQCWKEGRTGFPWIDAIMKQINQEGWTHHAGRHAAACFLTRGVLYISWLRGAAYFQEKLVDMDWPLNIGNWLWVSASTFFSEFRRVASPSTFPQRFDPEGKFVRKYIPALKNMPDKYVYEPWKASLKVQKTAGCLIGKDYPFPIVDAKLAIERCIAGMHRCYSDAEAGCTTSSARTNTPPPGSPNDMVYSYHTSGLSNATAPEVKLPN